ncbi:MAG TPA: hypothetical protein VIS49_14245 [Cyclobacteriaceae bacterium]
MRRLLSLIIVLFFLFSCSIIKDDDILSQEDFDKNLVLEGITISENTFGEMMVESLASFSYTSNGRLNSIYWNSMSADTDEEAYGGRELGKMRFNLFFDFNAPGGFASSRDITSSFIYDGSGKVVSISNRYDNGGIGTVLFQQFNYTYDGSGKLIEIETLNNQHDIFRKTRTVDVLAYTGNKITSVDRTLEINSVTAQQTITVKYSSIGVVSEIKKGNTTSLNNCAANVDYYYCYFSETTGGGGFSNSNIIYGEGSKPSKLSIAEQRFEENGTTGVFGDQSGRPPDHFFVSPYIFTPELFESGRDLAHIFIDDWWIKGVGTNSMFQVVANETVTLDFTYTLLK